MMHSRYTLQAQLQATPERTRHTTQDSFVRWYQGNSAGHPPTVHEMYAELHTIVSDPLDLMRFDDDGGYCWDTEAPSLPAGYVPLPSTDVALHYLQHGKLPEMPANEFTAPRKFYAYALSAVMLLGLVCFALGARAQDVPLPKTPLTISLPMPRESKDSKPIPYNPNGVWEETCQNVADALQLPIPSPARDLFLSTCGVTR